MASEDEALLSQVKALVEKDRMAQQAYMDQQAKEASRYRDRQRLLQYMRGPAEGETQIKFETLGEDQSCCGGQCTGLLADRSTQLAAVVCHPWGPLGGSMHDYCVSKIVSIFAKAGITTLRFNFRYGIGQGYSSAADLRGAVQSPRIAQHGPHRTL